MLHANDKSRCHAPCRPLSGIAARIFEAAPKSRFNKKENIMSALKNSKSKSKTNKPEAHQKADFEALLTQAITQPGIISEAYRAFHTFSLGNQMLAAQQLLDRGLALSPIASFRAWQEKGRNVQRGQSAISLYMPVTLKRKDTDQETGEETEIGFQKFIMRPHWFSLQQTEGDEYTPEAVIPEWNAELAMENLDIKEEVFNDMRGNVMGYAKARSLAINPLNPLKHKTRFHEIAHIVLGHTAESTMSDTPVLPRDLKEVEAESVAFILCSILKLPGQPESRGYIQSWLDGQTIPETNAKRIFGAADKILKAGQAKPTESDAAG
jgi:hypothetical protein